MSTRSVVAEPYGDTWRGRYVHSDGYPTWNGRTVWALVQRDGLQRVVDTVIHDHYGWSSLSDSQPDIAGVAYKPDARYQYGTPEYAAQVHGSDGMYGDGRFANIAGYGVAYTDTVIESKSLGDTPYQQVTEDQWHGPDDLDCFIEWVYILSPGGLLFGPTAKTERYKTYKGWDGKRHRDYVFELVPAGLFPWNGDEPDWQTIEHAGDDDPSEGEE